MTRKDLESKVRIRWEPCGERSERCVAELELAGDCRRSPSEGVDNPVPSCCQFGLRPRIRVAWPRVFGIHKETKMYSFGTGKDDG